MAAQILSEYIHCSRYARVIDDRRETYKESVDRYISFFSERFPKIDLSEARDFMYKKQLMPSMRAFANAGKALAEHHIACYNCAYCTFSCVEVFSELLYILMNGAGVGLSLERKFIEKLPIISKFKDESVLVVVQDSKEGWCESLDKVVRSCYDGVVPILDVSLVRPEGAPLKTFGGRASGPGPLVELCNSIVKMFKEREGKKLSSVDLLDISCFITQTVTVGGKRRGALIALTDLDDVECMSAKSGTWYETHPWRRMVNISAVYTEENKNKFFEEWAQIKSNGSGERGIFNRSALKDKRPAFRDPVRLDRSGCNVCGEATLDDGEFCNLSDIVTTVEDTRESLIAKARAAAVLTTLQGTLTDFKILREQWKFNCDTDKILGISLTGIQDCPLLNHSAQKLNPVGTISLLTDMKNEIIKVNKELSAIIGIPRSECNTCIKPSGTVSLLANTSAGIHNRHSQYYIRRIWASSLDPLTEYMIQKGIPHIMDPYDKKNVILSFPIKSPYLVEPLSCIDMFNDIMFYKKYWTEHNVSATVYMTSDKDWEDIGKMVYDNFNDICGITFFPKIDYALTPYEEITEEEYNLQCWVFPTDIDLSNFKCDEFNFEQEMACTGATCEIRS